MSEKVKHIPTQQALMAALNFTDADLKANREGYMTKAQRRRLKGRQRDAALWFIIAAVVLLALAILPMLAEYKLDFRRWLSLLISPGGLVWFFMIGFFALCAYAVRQHYRRDLYKGHVASVYGTLNKQVMLPGGQNAKGYTILLNGAYFMFTEQAIYDAFVDGEVYTLYYTPHTNTMLSAELADKE